MKFCVRRGYPSEHVIVADREQGGPVCDDVTVAGLKATLGSLEPDMVVAVGSGVINDLCKWSSFDLGVPYVVVATAASMNGYAAANVAATIDWGQGPDRGPGRPWRSWQNPRSSPTRLRR